MAVPACVRDKSEVFASFAAAGGRTGLDGLYQSGSLRLKLARPHDAARCEPILVNSGGGVAGGDALTVSLALDEDARVLATSQSAEKIYRAEHAPARIDVRLSLGPRSRLDWLPQETIVHDGARLCRTLDADMAPDASLAVLEMIVLGRIAHGEHVRCGRLHDRWRVRRDGRLALAEDVRLEGDIARLLERPALGGGARAVATLAYIAPDAESRLGPAREVLASARCMAGASAWNGMLVVRLAGPDPAAVRTAAAAAAGAVTGAPSPRSWSC